MGEVVPVRNYNRPSTGMLTLLLSDLGTIKDKAKVLHERMTAEGYAENEADIAAVSRLADDLRDDLLEYWVST